MRLNVEERIENDLPLQATVPLPIGSCNDALKIQVRTGTGELCVTQARSLLSWPDGSVKWALVLFAPKTASETDFELEIAHESLDPGTPLAHTAEGRVHIDTGPLSFSVPEVIGEEVHQRTEGILTDLQTHRDGQNRRLTTPRLDAGLIATEADGAIYSNQKAGPAFIPPRGAPMETAGVNILEAGPLRCQIRIAGKLCRSNYFSSLDYIIKVEAYKNSGLVKLQLAWLHGADLHESEARFIRDLRLRLPLSFTPEEVRFGIDLGECAEEFLESSSYSLLQEDMDRYWLRRHDWDGDDVDLGHGSASGRKAPGWTQIVGSEGDQLNLYFPHFVEEYPNEIEIKKDALEIGLWPERANAHLSSKRIMPPNDASDGPADRHRSHRYQAIIAHPYLAFFSEEYGCLETVKGMQKTQEIYLDATAGLSGADWQERIEQRMLPLQRAAVTPSEVDRSRVLGAISTSGENAESERALDGAIGWIDNHQKQFEVYGKFDVGDLRYMVMSPYMTHYRHKSLKMHPRLHYWNNNEEDPIHGLFVNSLRKGRVDILDLVEVMGRHLWDVDVRHYPYWGLHTHSGGHCFRSIADRATDHFWITALIDYYLLTGDPDVYRGVQGLARYAAAHLQEIRFADTNLREVSIAVMQAVEYYHVLHEDSLLDAAESMGKQIVEEQLEAGYYPGRGHRAAAASGEADADWPHALFGSLALEALAALDEVRPSPEWRASAIRQIDWFLANGLLPARDGICARMRPDGGRNTGGHGYDPGYHDYKLVDFQLLKCLGYAIRWMREAGKEEKADSYQRAGDRILNRLIRVQLTADFGPGYEGNWNESEQIADVPEGETPERSMPRDLVDPQRCPYQIRPLGVSAALRCLPFYLAARNPSL